METGRIDGHVCLEYRYLQADPPTSPPRSRPPFHADDFKSFTRPLNRDPPFRVTYSAEGVTNCKRNALCTDRGRQW